MNNFLKCSAMLCLALISNSAIASYGMQIKVNGLVVDVAASSLSDGAGVVQWWWQSGNNQRWDFQAQYESTRPSGTPWACGEYGCSVFVGYRIINVNSRKCLDVPNANAYSGNQLIQYDCYNGSAKAQQWLQKNCDSNGWCEWRLRSNENYCLDSPGGQGAGARMQIWACNGSANQRFVVFPQ